MLDTHQFVKLEGTRDQMLRTVLQWANGDPYCSVCTKLPIKPNMVHCNGPDKLAEFLRQAAKLIDAAVSYLHTSTGETT